MAVKDEGGGAGSSRKCTGMTGEGESACFRCPFSYFFILEQSFKSFQNLLSLPKLSLIVNDRKRVDERTIYAIRLSSDTLEFLKRDGLIRTNSKCSMCDLRQ